MLKAILTSSLLLFSTNALADGYSPRSEGVIVDVQAEYRISYVPVTREECFEARVPVHSYAPPSTGDVLAGALIGGVIGNQFGGGSGNDIATALGAIIGADSASRNSRDVIGYSYEWQCRVVTTMSETREFDSYRVTYLMNGRYHTFNTQKNYHVGQRVVIK